MRFKRSCRPARYALLGLGELSRGLVSVLRRWSLGNRIVVPNDHAFDTLGDVWVLFEELFDVLSALAQFDLTERVESSALFDDSHLGAHFNELALFADALIEHDVELSDLERWSDLVLDHPGAYATADDLARLLE